MDAFIRAVEVFFDYLTSISVEWLVLAVVVHLARGLGRSRAWRNIIAAAYPNAEVRWRHIYAAYVAGVGVNAVLPARGGDLVKLYIAQRSVPGATYATLASTFAVETIFDLVASVSLFVWALQQDVLPGFDVLPDLPAFDLAWVIDHPVATVVMAVALLAALAFVASHHLADFRHRLVQGLAVLGTVRVYLRSVAAWQAVEWGLRVFETYCFLRVFGLDEAGLREALLVQVTSSISTLIPLTPAGIGTDQALAVYVLRGQFPTTAVLSFSVGMKLVLIGVNLVVGFVAIWLSLRTFRWRRHAEQSGPGTPFGTDGA